MFYAIMFIASAIAVAHGEPDYHGYGFMCSWVLSLVGLIEMALRRSAEHKAVILQHMLNDEKERNQQLTTRTNPWEAGALTETEQP